MSLNDIMRKHRPVASMEDDSKKPEEDTQEGTEESGTDESGDTGDDNTEEEEEDPSSEEDNPEEDTVTEEDDVTEEDTQEDVPSEDNEETDPVTADEEPVTEEEQSSTDDTTEKEVEYESIPLDEFAQKVIKLNEVSSALESAIDEQGEVEQRINSLQRVQNQVDLASEEQGLTPQSAEFLRGNMEDLIGEQTTNLIVPATESFGRDFGRIQVSVEASKNIGEIIYNAVIDAGKWLMDLISKAKTAFTNAFDFKETLKKEASNIKENASKAQTATIKLSGSKASIITVSGKTVAGSELIAKMRELIEFSDKALKDNTFWQYTTKIAALSYDVNSTDQLNTLKDKLMGIMGEYEIPAYFDGESSESNGMVLKSTKPLLGGFKFTAAKAKEKDFSAISKQKISVDSEEPIKDNVSVSGFTKDELLKLSEVFEAVAKLLEENEAITKTVDKFEKDAKSLLNKLEKTIKKSDTLNSKEAEKDIKSMLAACRTNVGMSGVVGPKVVSQLIKVSNISRTLAKASMKGAKEDKPGTAVATA